MKKILLGALLAGTLAASDPGLSPRRSVEDYKSKTDAADFSVGAVILSPETVRKVFATELNRGYVVVEIAFYPKPDRQIDINTRDFMLRVAGGKVVLRPAMPSAVAASLQRGKDDHRGPGRSNRDVTVIPTAEIGYQSGNVYDPVTGQRRGGGVYSSTGVIVAGGNPGGGSPPPASTPRDRDVMQNELADQMIPEGVTRRAVAGYLYFPLPDKKKPSTFDLEFDGSAGKFELPLFVEH